MKTIDVMYSIVLAGLFFVAGILSTPYLRALPMFTPKEPSSVVINGEANAAAGKVEIGFAQDMSLHHEQAILMGRLASQKGSAPQVRLVGEAIVRQQLIETGYLQGWLLLWRAPRTTPNGKMEWMKGKYEQSKKYDAEYERFIALCSQEGQSMPGFASMAEIEQLNKSTGKQFDQLFAHLMLAHHRGAVVMARFAAENAESFTSRTFAKTMKLDQEREMTQLQTMLTR